MAHRSSQSRVAYIQFKLYYGARQVVSVVQWLNMDDGFVGKSLFGNVEYC